MTEWVEALWGEQQFYNQGIPRLNIISTNQSSWSWRKALETEDSIPPLVDSASLARQLAGAEDIHEQYCLDLSQNTTELTEETLFYLSLKTKKDKIVSDRKGCSSSQAAMMLIEHLKTQEREQNLYVFGFVEIPPLYSELILRVTNAPINILSDDNRNLSCSTCTALDSDEALVFASQWAKEKTASQSGKSIAIVIPDLNIQNESIRTHFFKAFEPEAYLSKDTLAPSIFDLSIGKSLWDVKLVHDAILLIKLLDKTINLETANILVSSPYWALSHHEQRCVAQNRLSQHTHLTLPTSAFIHLFNEIDASENEAVDTPSIRHFLIKMRNQVQETKVPRPVSAWVSWFVDYLNLAGWPGEQSLNSNEYQYSQAFLALLEEISSFEAYYSEPIPFLEFRSLLEESCLQRTAQIELKQPKVRIMGLMEAAGQRFDHCLILGLNEKSIPQGAKPNPFLPIDLQKKQATPKSSPDREFEYSLKLLQSIKATTRHLVLNWYTRDELGETHPSPILNEISTTVDDTDEPQSIETFGISKYMLSKLKSNCFDQIEVGLAPSIPKGSLIKGGASHLSAYWNNPMFSYFQYRLNINKSPDVYIGLSPMVKGMLSHTILEHIYTQIQSKSELKEFLNKETFNSEIGSLIDSIWQSHWSTIGRVPLTIEAYAKESLKTTITMFLNLDANRSEEFKIHSLEQKVRLNILDYYLDIRLDRVDQVASNYSIVIDYKTGKNSLSSLNKQNTADFQLPLYALSQKENQIEAVTFAEINETEAKFIGVCSDKIQIQGISQPENIRNSELPETWESTLEHWQVNAESIVRSLSQGKVDYLPRNKSTEAYYLHFEQAVREEERDQ